MFVRDICGIIEIEKFECAKFRGSRAIVGLVGLVPWCLRGYFVGSKLFSWVFRGSKIFFRGCTSWFPIFFVISWVHDFFSAVFRGSKIFHRGYFVGSKSSLVGNFVISQTMYFILNRFQQL